MIWGRDTNFRHSHPAKRWRMKGTWMDTIRIVNGPDVAEFFEALKTPQRPMVFTIEGGTKINVRPKSFKYEDGSGVSFNLDYYIAEEDGTDPALPVKSEGTLYYHAGRKGGTIKRDNPV